VINSIEKGLRDKPIVAQPPNNSPAFCKSVFSTPFLKIPPLIPTPEQMDLHFTPFPFNFTFSFFSYLSQLYLAETYNLLA